MPESLTENNFQLETKGRIEDTPNKNARGAKFALCEAFGPPGRVGQGQG